MRFSVIMPSYLGAYKNAASKREIKIVRAIESVMVQSFSDFELIIIADGCKKTVEICEPYFYEYLPKIRILEIPKQNLWSGAVRNAGIEKANGDIIVYLDIDDVWGENHLQIINDGFGNYDWVWFNYYIWNIMQKQWQIFECNVDIMGRCGTSSIAHKKSIGAYWKDNSYYHDYYFIQTLKARSKNYNRIEMPEYFVCHLPNDRAGYDV